ncbi:PaaI family thioesterase [Nocardioides jiangxiensis]|uniref:PaaI family thioesterase n=1 Tax=Nocardioides jiangxiensis TaxID=3064524 RepID=A0ABT9AYN6_9ACTN|nr:PaaI family thioesterase [Nocardioides sp. WY-20]MDO7867043.1 PaaI family thioesterase [Nocardioides sp. WY-20]
MTALTELTGLEQLRLFAGMDTSAIPNIGGLLGMEIELIDEGRVAFAVTTRPDFANPMGNVHGGICATLLDSVMGCAVHTTLAPGESYATVELKVNYTGSVATDGRRLTATGEIIHVGGRIATAEGRVVDEDGRLVAHGTTTCIVNR